MMQVSGTNVAEVGVEFKLKLYGGGGESGGRVPES